MTISSTRDKNIQTYTTDKNHWLLSYSVHLRNDRKQYNEPAVLSGGKVTKDPITNLSEGKPCSSDLKDVKPELNLFMKS
jgi:hypothetical protein